MPLPAAGLLASLLARAVGGSLFRTAAARLTGGGAAALTRPLMGKSPSMASLLPTGTVANFRQPVNAAQTSGDMLRQVFMRSPTPTTNASKPNITQRISNIFTSPRSAQIAPQGSVVPASPMASISGRAFQTLAGGLAGGSGAGSGGVSGNGGGTGGAGGGASLPGGEKPKSVSDIIASGALVATMFGGLAAAGKKLAETQVEGQRHLINFNGKIAGAFARSNAADIRRNITSGSNTQDSTAALVQSVSELKDAVQPLADMATVAVNLYITPLVRGMAAVTKAISDQLAFFGFQAPGKNKDRSPWERAVVDLAKHSRDNNRIPRFRN